MENKAQTEQYCMHYPYNTQVGISVSANLQSKMRIEPQSDYFASSPSWGAGLGVHLYQRIYKWFGIQIGVEYNHVGISFGGTTNPAQYFKDISTKYYTDIFIFPILFNASYYFNGKHGLDISLGGAPLILPHLNAPEPVGISYSRIEGGYSEEEDYWRFAIGNYPRFNFSLYGKIGYNFLFKNKNTLGVAIVGSYATESYAQGTYSVAKKEGTKIESGHVSLRNTYVGVQFSYGFSMKKLLCNPN
ncbi:MAG: hypothetical protein GX330_08175 [Bacteroidales bacterium]|nr:hypothetical protein [Bacteroidales bacterium]